MSRLPTIKREYDIGRVIVVVDKGICFTIVDAVKFEHWTADQWKEWVIEQIGSKDVGGGGGGMFVANFRTAFPSVITPFLPYNLIDITADDHTQDVTLHFSAKPIYVLFININTTASEQSGFSIKDKIVGNDLELSFDYSGWGNLRGTFFVFF